MSAPSRSAQFAKLQKVLRKHYQPVPPVERPVLDQLLFACCLENAHYDKAEEAFAALVHTFFDWNEIRVTTVKELAEVLSSLPDPFLAANRIKRILQNVFEASYNFDLEDLKKKNLGVAVERLQKMNGTTAFAVAYVVQAALGGHSIPADSGTLRALRVVQLVTDKDVQEESVPGLERAIPKNKGAEFGSLLHQLGADFAANPYSSALHKILLQINPDVEALLPKRRAKEAKAAAVPAEPKPTPSKPHEGKSQESKSHAAKPPEAKAHDKAPEVKSPETKPHEPKAKVREKPETPAAAAAPAADEEKSRPKSAPARKKGTEPESAAAAVPAEPAREEAASVKRKPASAKKAAEPDEGRPAASKSAEASQGTPSGPPAATKKTAASTSAGLAKRKPR
jgi:endonuclease III